jgi:glycosyltransferase involved in cell wall biosynthesis
MTRPYVVVQFSSLPPTARYGGAEQVVGDYAVELEQAGFTVHSYGLKPRGGKRSGPEVAISNIYWPFDGPRRGPAQRAVWHAIDTFALASKRAVRKVIDELRPDVVVTHNLRGWGYAPWVVAGERGIPLVHVVHDYSLICNSSTLWHGGVSADVCTACRPRVAMTGRRWPGGNVVAVSQAVLSEHQRRLGLEDFKHAVVIHPTGPDQDPQPTGRAQSTGAPNTIGYLGRISEHKGVDLLVAAVDGSDKKLILAGEGDRDYLDRLMSSAPDNVQYRGWIDDHRSFFDEIDVLAAPSVWLDPFPIVVRDGARAGVPVLIADRPGLIEAAHVHGARHATFEANNVAALRQALDRPLSSYRVGPAITDQVDIIELISRLASERKTG